MTADKTVNYTDTQVQDLQTEYLAGATVEALAAKLGKSTRSVIAKLAQLGVYKVPEKEASARITKADMTRTLEARFNQAKGTFASLEKADKAALEKLLQVSLVS